MSKINHKKKQNQSPKNKIIIPLAVSVIIFIVIGFGMSYFKKNLFTVIKIPDFELADQNNRKITTKDMLEKVYQVEFFYSHCPTIFPVINKNMKYIQDEINNPDFGIISISIDPENDTPEVLKNHAKMVEGTSSQWHFLTGNRDYIRSLAYKFDIYVGDKEDEAESLNHSGMIALVDKEGNLRSRFDEHNIPILYYSGLNYEDEQGKTPNLRGRNIILTGKAG